MISEDKKGNKYKKGCVFLKKRSLIRILSYLLAALFVLSIYFFKFYKKAKVYESEITYTYSRSLEEVGSSLNKINVALEKLPYVTSASGVSKLAADIYTEAKIAKQAFSQLPTGDYICENLNKFFSQVGNYTVYLAERVIDGEELSETEKAAVDVLSEMAEEITDSFGEIQVNVNRHKYWSKVLDENIGEVLSNDIFVNSLDVLENSMTDYPTLLYDGPYSDHIRQGESYLVKNAEPISEDTAFSIISNAFSIDREELSIDSYDNGKISAINFVYGEGSASVSLNGGYLINFRKYNVSGQNNLSYAEAQKKAEKFVNENLSETFMVNFYFADNGTCVFNMARTQNGIIYYPDLIKVGVDMSNGDIVFFDARAYIMNYKERKITMPSEEKLLEAKDLVEKSLKVNSSSVAVIPTDGEMEKVCFEFYCKAADDKEFLIYLNAETLKEEQIFRIFKTNGGTLVK